MYKFKENILENEYNEFIKNYSMASFMQDYNWSNIKDNWTSLKCGLYKNKKLVGVCSILVKYIFKKLTIFYIPRGYLIDFTNYEDLNEMTKNIKKLAKKYNAYCVKIDPNFCISETSMKNDEISLNYSKNYEIINDNLKKIGYKYTGTHKDMHKNFQPQYNMFAPLCNKENIILTTEQLLATYKSKFKYYLGNFHTKRGITFEITNDKKRVKDLVKLLKETEEKQNINLRNEEYFNKIMDNYKDLAYLVFAHIDLNKYLDFLNQNNGKEEEILEVKDLLNKNINRMCLSASLIILPKNEKGIRTSEYLYAGNSSKFNKLHASAGLVLEILNFSIKNNCHYCNLGGIDGNLNDKLTSFKQGFNGIVMEFMGEYDLPTSFIYYPIKLLYPLFVKIYKKIR